MRTVITRLVLFVLCLAASCGCKATKTHTTVYPPKEVSVAGDPVPDVPSEGRAYPRR